MAEKKFFVDINLQGSALTNAKIGTNSGIGSTEGAFGYDSGSHRLQYFNGSATQNVANLSDISAVTGGLIFQGGYDPTTNTPDITDGSALKGFFWAATAAGTFLGESVQVGDSIVAKVDNAGATIADWLILQGNIVIATDSVDGISRLATQTEANDGTEGGAVVITPATLQGKIDAQITPEINSKLSKSGGTMSGAIDMGGNDIINPNLSGATLIDHLEGNGKQIRNLAGLDVGVIGGNGGPLLIGTSKLAGDLNADTNPIINLPAPTNGGDATNKTYVDDNTSNKLPLDGGTMSGDIDMGNNGITNANRISTGRLETQFLAGGDKDYTGNINVVNDLDFRGLNKINGLIAPVDGSEAANKTYVDNAASTAQANAEAYADSLAPNYDAAGSAATAQANAEAYADSLAPNYDAAGSAAQALTDANAYSDSLAPNYDAAGAAATAESNANAYTDTEIAAQSYRIELASGDWVLNGSTYEATITHNLNSSFPVVTFTDSNNETVELIYKTKNPISLKVKSNILPDFIGVSLVAVR